jgi:Mrp family chromosome partitioning ATPase
VKAGYLSEKAIHEAQATLGQANVKILGAVLNQAKIRRDYYYH